jgi:hypothetical protein
MSDIPNGATHYLQHIRKHYVKFDGVDYWVYFKGTWLRRIPDDNFLSQLIKL